MSTALAGLCGFSSTVIRRAALAAAAPIPDIRPDVKSCSVCRSNFSGKPPRCPIDGGPLVDVGPDLLAGRVIAGHYRIIDRRGAGATSEVYRAHDVRAGTFVAVRILSPAAARDPRHRTYFTDHATAWKKAAAETVLVPVLDVVPGGLDGRDFCVSEFVQTPALQHVLLAGAVPLPAAIDSVITLAGLLDRLHGREILARDLRPGAVFLSTTPTAVVRLSSDALVLGPVAAPDPPSGNNSFLPFVHVPYASPERLRGEPTGSPSDVYALGALFYEVLTGHPVFLGTAKEVAEQHLQSPVPVLRHVNPSMPAELEALLARMLAKVPRFRPTAAEVAKALHALRR